MKNKLMWRKIAIITLIVAVGSISLLSCELPDFSDRNKSGVVGKTATGADLIVMDTDTVDSTLVNITPGVSLTFNGLKPEYVPAKGDIINAGPSKAAPDGFFYKVKNVSTADGVTVVEVETAAIEEAVEEVEFTQTFDLPFDDGGELWLAEGVEAEIIYIDAEYEDGEYEDGDSEARAVEIGNESIAALKITINEKVKGVTLTGTVEISQTIKWDIKTDDWVLERFELSTTPRFKADITASVGKDFEKEFKKTIAKENFARIVFWVGPVCVTLKPQLTVDLVVTAKGEVSLSAKLASWDKSYTFGVQYAKGGKLAGFQKNTSQPTKYLEGLELEMNGEVKAGPKVSFMFGLWDAAYAGMSAGVYSRLEGKASASTSGASASLSLLWGLELGAEAKLEILSKIIAELSVNFFNKEWTIWSKTMSTSAATLQSVSANGSSSASTTQLTLTFDKKITGLSAADISLSALSGGVSVTKGTLSGSGPTYTLAVTVSTTGGTLNVSVNKAGYTISGSPKSVTVYYKAPTAATLQSVSANGSSSTTTTQLTLTFDKAITGLSASDISLSALSGGVSVTKGTLSGSGPTYTLGVTVSTTGGTLNVSVNKAGYTISGSPKSVTVYYKADPNATAVTLQSVSANGNASTTTTQLTLTFSQAITGLAAADITLSGVSGVSKGALSGSGGTYTLPINGFTAGGTLSVAVAKAGYNISGSPKNATIYYYASPGATAINTADIPGVAAPATGGTPVTSITGNAQYSGTVTWSPNHTTFAAGTAYTATITLAAKSGYTLQGVAANFFTVAGTTSVSNPANSGVVTAVFPSTAGTAENPATIDIAAIPGVTPPAIGGTPVTAITETAQYTGIVTWNPNHSAFTTLTQYVATITLTAKTGFTLQGVRNNFFTVGGAITVSNSANSGVVTAVFFNDSWTNVANSAFGTNYIRSIAYGGGKFVAGGSGGTMAYSTDGINWTAISNSQFLSTDNICGIAYNGTRFVAVSYRSYSGMVNGTGQISYSSDGISWTSASNPMSSNNNIEGIAYGGDKFVAVGDYGKTAYSTNGTSWSFVTINSFSTGQSHILGIAYGGGKFVAVGNDGKMAYSTNGTSWTAVGNSTFGTSKIRSIAYGGGKFVAGSDDGKMAYSSDGTNWTTVGNSTFDTNGIYAIAYGNGKFVAVGYPGKIAYSSDGVTWTAALAYSTFGTNTIIQGITYGDGKFIIGGGSGKMAYQAVE